MSDQPPVLPALTKADLRERRSAQIVSTQTADGWETHFVIERISGNRDKHDRIHRGKRCTLEQILKAAEVLGIQL